MSFVLYSVAVLVSACGEIGVVPDPPADLQPLEEKHGTRLTPASSKMPIEWSAANKLAFIRPGHAVAAVRNMGNGALRKLPIATPDSFLGVQMQHIGLGEGGQVFVSENTALGVFVYRYSTDSAADLLTTRGARTNEISIASYPARGLPLGDVAYVHRDTLYVKRGTAAAARIADGCKALVALSPDGGEAVCVSGDGSMRRVSLTTGAITPVPIPSGAQILEVIWNVAGLHFLTKISTVYSLVRPDGSLLSAPPPTKTHFPYGDVVVSRDASKIAYWAFYCAKPGGFEACSKGQRLLYVANLATGLADWVAVHSDGDARSYNGALAFSPDGTRIAYVFDDELYVSNSW
jgi:hypothetical protein